MYTAKDNRPRLMILSSEKKLTEKLKSSFHSAGDESRVPKDVQATTWNVDVVGSLEELCGTNLDGIELVLSALRFEDGNGCDAVREVHRVMPDLPVVIIAAPHEFAFAREGLLAGAIDILPFADANLSLLPGLVEKWKLQQRIRNEDARTLSTVSRSLFHQGRTTLHLRRMIERLEEKSRTDALTRLFNRRWMQLMLDGAWAEADRYDLPLAFLMLDIDGFKKFNDLYGHQRGDQLLTLTARIIEANCRDVDVVARYGGDEFCVLMPHTDQAAARQVAERIVYEFEFAMSIHPTREPRISLSVGVAHNHVSRPVNAQQLIAHADLALYSAKASYRDRVMIMRTDELAVT